jgi:hypothetical protein
MRVGFGWWSRVGTTESEGRKHGPAQPVEDIFAALPKGTSGSPRVREVGSGAELDDVFDRLTIGGTDGTARPGFSKIIARPTERRSAFGISLRHIKQ